MPSILKLAWRRHAGRWPQALSGGDAVIPPSRSPGRPPEVTVEDAAGGVADEALDLCGEVCPYTFLKSKLALEELAPGQVLRIIVDNETSARDVPQALHGTGHTVLEVGTPGPGLWTIVVRRGRVSGSEAAPDSGTATVARRTGRVV